MNRPPFVDWFSSFSACLTAVFAGLLLLGGVTSAEARIWHVATDGNDTAAGSAKAPFRTIQRAADQMKPGDNCLIQAGIYRETVRPPEQSDAGRRTFRADGQVIVTGAEPVGQWTTDPNRSGVYTATVNWSVDQLLIDGQMQILAREPNLGDNRFEPNTVPVTADDLSFDAPAFDQPAGTWDGATLWAMGPRRWVAGTATIADSQPGKLTLESKVPFFNQGKGTAYIEGALPALDAPGEWVQVDDTIHLIPPDGVDPTEARIEATKRRWGFDLSGRRDITLDGISFIAASVNTDKATGCIIENSRFRYPGFRRDIRGGFNRDGGMSIESGGLGVVLGGSNNILRDSVIAESMGDGVSVYGRNNRVENCVIRDTNYSASDCAPVDLTGQGHTVTRCTIFNAGRSGILHRKLAGGTITQNHIHHVGLMTTDLGGTYCFTTDGKDTEIAFNRIHDVRCKTGVGIYIDNISRNFRIHHNLVYDNRNSGIRLNTPANNIAVYHNTLARNGNAIAYWGAQGNKDMEGVVVRNNMLLGDVALGEGATDDHNLTEGEPRFVAPDNHDFRLQADSPAVDAGAVLDEQLTGRAEPRKHTGDAPDLGAFERNTDPWQAGSTIPESQWMDE